MTVLALDPGSQQTAYVVWDGSKIHCMDILPNEALLGMLCFATNYDLTVIEMIGHYGTGMPAGADVFDTCIWIGRFFQACSVAPMLIKRQPVKLYLCGSARAKDANVRQAILDKFGGKDAAIGKKASPGPFYGVKSHIWAALALAIYAHETAGQMKAA